MSDPTPTAPAGADKRAQTEAVLGDILRLMGFPAKLDLKDGNDGGISVALHFEAEPHFAPKGKRSFVVDSLQFLVNKVVNRPNTERRWVTVGVGAHPEPRGPRAQAPANGGAAPVPAGAPAAPSAPAAATTRGPGGGASPGRPARQAPSPAPAAARSEGRGDADESRLDAPPDPALERLGRELAARAAKLGRFYAVTLLEPADRARLLRAATGTPGMSVRVEGEAHLRRLVFAPDKPAPMPKKSALPDFPDDDDEE